MQADFRPYEGDSPYIFVSYSHQDSGRVIPILNALNGAGYHIWYDDGIPWAFRDSTLYIEKAPGTDGTMPRYFGIEVPWKKHSKQIHTVEIRRGVTKIGWYAFFDCKGLTSVTIPDSVTEIGDSAFANCPLSSVDISEKTNLGWHSFDKRTRIRRHP